MTSHEEIRRMVHAAYIIERLLEEPHRASVRRLAEQWLADYSAPPPLPREVAGAEELGLPDCDSSKGL